MKKDFEAPEPVPLAEMSDSFLSGTSAAYLEALESDHARGGAVEPSWANFLQAMAANGGTSPAQLARAYAHFGAMSPRPHPAAAPATVVEPRDDITGTKVLTMIQAFQALGHRMADCDPLGLQEPEDLACLSPEFYDLRADEMLQQVSRQPTQPFPLSPTPHTFSLYDVKRPRKDR